MRKIVFTKTIDKEYIEKITEIAPGWEIIHGNDSSEWLSHLKDAEIVAGSWNRHVAGECLKEGASLKWFHTWAAGVNNLPLEEFKRRGIILTNSSGVHANPISETILAMMLAFARGLNKYIKAQTEKKWIHTSPLSEIHGTTVGILGVGAIGEETARLAKAFNMKVLGMRRSGEPSPYVDVMYDQSGINELLRLSDFVVNALPLTDQTRHLIGKEQFSVMKPTAYFINIGRGQTVDTGALIEALKKNRIAGAGLDVFEEEPLPPESPLWDMDNVIITPHSSGTTVYYDQRVMDILIPNLKSYVNGGLPEINMVDFERQY